MFKKAAGDPGYERDKKKKSNGLERGTTDELEIIRMIVQQNSGLLARVMDKIRTSRSLARGQGVPISAAQQAFNTRANKLEDDDEG